MSALSRVLVVEDDRALRDGLALNLRSAGYDVTTAADGDEGMRLAFDSDPELIILDVMLPGWSGLEILDELRRRGSQVPVLILSARGTPDDKVEGLDLGADDYLAKPFDLPELLARVKVLLRRAQQREEAAPEITLGSIVISPGCREVTVKGRPVALSSREFDLLVLLAEAEGRVLPREAILDRVWGWDYEGTERTVDNFVTSLRKKLKLGRRSTVRIVAVPRVGYRMETD